jgi:hypothetical protein
MPSVPHYNAELLLVNAVGGYADYDTPASHGAAKWAGNGSGAGVYFREKKERRTEGGNSNVVVGRTLVVPAELGVEWENGDTLTLELRDGSQLTPPAVKLVERPESPPGLPGTVRLTLEDE